MGQFIALSRKFDQASGQRVWPGSARTRCSVDRYEGKQQYSFHSQCRPDRRTCGKKYAIAAKVLRYLGTRAIGRMRRTPPQDKRPNPVATGQFDRLWRGRPNFTLKLVRPGFGPAAELPASSPA